MFRRRPPKPPRLHGDLPILRRHYAELAGEDASGERCLAWLRSAGLDPETGRMTDAGLELYHRLLHEQATKRGSRREPRRFKGRVQNPR